MSGVFARGDVTETTVTASRGWFAVALLSTLYILSFIDRLILALLIDPVKSDLGVTDVQVGLLIGTSFAIVYSISGLPIARLVDIGNRKLLIFVGAVLWGVSTACAAFAGSFMQLLVLRVGVALGEAALTPAAMSLISDMFSPAKRAFPLSVFVMVGVCGGSGAMIAGAAVLQFVAQAGDQLPLVENLAPWRLTLLLVGIPAVLVALLIPFILPNPPREPVRTGEGASVRDIANHYRRNPVTYLGFYIVTALVSSVNFAILTWFPTHLIRNHALAAADAGYLFGLFGVAASLVGGLALPFAARRMAARGRHDGPMIIALVVCIVSTPLLYLSLTAASAQQSMLAVAVPLVLQLGLGILLASTAPLLAPGRIRGQLVALFYLVLTLIGLGVGPTLVATMAERTTLAQGSISMALAIVVVVFAPVQIVAILLSRRAFARTQQEALAMTGRA